jgi:hypothetical protein
MDKYYPQFDVVPLALPNVLATDLVNGMARLEHLRVGQ